MFIGKILVIAFLKLLLIRHASLNPLNLCDDGETFEAEKGCVPIKSSGKSVLFEVNYEERRRTFPLKFRPKESVRMESQDVIRNPTQVEAIQKIIQAMIDKANCSLGTSYKLLKGCIPHRLKPEMLDLGLKPNDTLESLFDLEHLQNKIVEDLTNKFEDTLPAHLKLERSNESDDLESKEVKNEALFEEQSKRKQETYVKAPETPLENQIEILTPEKTPEISVPTVEQIIRHVKESTSQENENAQNQIDQSQIIPPNLKQKLKQEIDQIENQEKTQENDKRSKESPEMSAEEADNLTEKYPFIIDETEGTGLNDYRSTDEPSSNSLAQNGSQEQLTENVSTREPQRIQVKQKVRADSLSQLQENQSQNKIRRFDDNKMDKKILQNDATSSTDKPIENKVNEESTEKNLPLAESQALESSAPNTTLKESPELSTNAPEMKTESTVALKQNNQEKFTQKPTANNQQPPVKKAPLNPIKQMVDFHFDIKNKTANFISNQLAPKIMDLPGHIVKSQNNAAKGVFGKMLGMSRRQAISIPMQDAEDINEIRAKFPPAEYQFDTVEHKVLEGTELGQGDSNGDQQQGDNEGNQEAMDLGRSKNSKSKKKSQKEEELKSTASTSESPSTTQKSSTLESSTSSSKLVATETEKNATVAYAINATKLN